MTALSFDKDGVKLASGSKDTDIIIWDLIAETGLFKLRGHKDQITGLEFLYPSDLISSAEGEANQLAQSESSSIRTQSARELLVSTGKDALIKLWDVGSQHCFETHVAQNNGECWRLAVGANHFGIITAGNEGELKFWSIDLKSLTTESTVSPEESKQPVLRERGALYRHGKDRTMGVQFHPRGNYIAAHGSDKALEVWRIRSETEVRKALLRKKRRQRQKEKGESESLLTNGDAHNSSLSDMDLSSAEISDFIVPYVIVRTGGKVASFDWAGHGAKTDLGLLVATTNNLLELWSIKSRPTEKTSKADEPPEYLRSSAVEIPGHRTDIRALALSSDDRMLASASNGALKIWNVRTSSCLRSLECGYALCASFLPGDKIVVVGNRNGELELFDISSSSLLERERVHDGPIWTLHVHPDGRSIATGSADKSVKFFDFEVTQEEIPGTRRTAPRFRLVHKRTLKVSDDILSLRFSPDSRLIALALLDNTVKVFYVDSLKLFLSLYGHKLPVLDMDISHDSKMIVTCSADKNVRLWGLDFGDCHKALFAHQDSIIKVAFVPQNQDGNGRHFFSASKDRLVKYWDGDKFEQIQKLGGHHGEIWAIAISRTGDFLVSASHDKSIRIWEQTDEQIFLEEEREKEMEELYEKTLTSSLEQDGETGDDAPEAVSASKQTVETLMAGEKIIEALDVGSEDLELMAAYRQAKASQPSTAVPARNPIYLANGGISAEKHLLIVMQRIKAAALQDALLVLPFDKIPQLFTFLRIWAERQWNMPLTCRVLFFMLKTHYKQIIANKTMRVLLDEVQLGLRGALMAQKDEAGYDLAAMKFVGKRQEEIGKGNYVDEELWEKEEKGKRKKKRAFVDIA